MHFRHFRLLKAGGGRGAGGGWDPFDPSPGSVPAMVENIILQHPQGCSRFFYSLSLLQSIFILSLFLRLPSLFESILVICRVLPNDTTFVDFRSVSDNKFLSVSCYMWSILQSISLLPFAYYFSTKLNHHCGFFFLI